MWRFFRCKNWHIIKSGNFDDGTRFTEYVYNGKRYTHIGDTFPPRLKVSFSLPIREAYVNERNVTDILKRFIGPVGGGEIPATGYMFPELKLKFFYSFQGYRLRVGIRWVYTKGQDVEIDVCNILGHWSTLGANKK